MNKRLQRLWLFFTNWMELDTFDTEEELDDQLELLLRICAGRFFVCTGPQKQSSCINMLHIFLDIFFNYCINIQSVTKALGIRCKVWRFSALTENPLRV